MVFRYPQVGLCLSMLLNSREVFAHQGTVWSVVVLMNVQGELKIHISTEVSRPCAFIVEIVDSIARFPLMLCSLKLRLIGSLKPVLEKARTMS